MALKRPESEDTSIRHQHIYGLKPKMEQYDDETKTGKTEDESLSISDWFRRHDIRMWLSGLLFMIALLGAMFGIGAARGWNAPSGYAYNQSASTRERFLPEPFVPEPGVKGRDGPDAAGRWYFWKLPPDEVTWYTRMFVWVCYCCHQIFVWIVQYKFQTEKTENGKTYNTVLRKWNYVYFGINVFFHLLHLLQTHLTYDATAQDVSIASSQCSVILMLTFITLMEYRTRGLFFGWPTPAHKGKWSTKLRLNQAPVYVIRRYHGYLCAWGSVYTMWYHPMENTWGHALGFFHTWMVLLQGSLMFSKFHLNPYWKLLQEVWVAIHAGVVAAQTGGPVLDGTKLWPMFVFGFLTMFSLTQLFGLPFWKKIHFLFRLVPLVIVLAVSITMYSQFPEAEGTSRWARLRELIQIPLMYYADILIAYVLLYLFLACERRGKKPEENSEPIPAITHALYVVAAFSMYGIFVILSALIVVFDLKLGLLTFTFILLFILTVTTTISFMFTKQVVGQGTAKIRPT